MLNSSLQILSGHAITLAVKHWDTKISFHQPYFAFYAFTGHKNEPSLTGALAKFVKRAVVDQLANKFLACRAFYLLVTRFYGANDDRAFLLTMKIKHVSNIKCHHKITYWLVIQTALKRKKCRCGYNLFPRFKLWSLSCGAFAVCIIPCIFCI